MVITNYYIGVFDVCSFERGLKWMYQLSWIDTADRSAKNILSSEKQLNDSLERIRISNDTVDSLESRMSEIVSHLLTGKDSFDVMLEGEKTDE